MVIVYDWQDEDELIDFRLDVDTQLDELSIVEDEED